jgi:hypothetical protein
MDAILEIELYDEEKKERIIKHFDMYNNTKLIVNGNNIKVLTGDHEYWDTTKYKSADWWNNCVKIMKIKRAHPFDLDYLKYLIGGKK